MKFDISIYNDREPYFDKEIKEMIQLREPVQ
jgi:hypothetical protein